MNLSIIDSNVFPIETEEQFQAACARIEELLPLCWEDVPDDDPKNIELAVIANLVADWEDEHVNLSISSRELNPLTTQSPTAARSVAQS